jgi:hypothetical protein
MNSIESILYTGFIFVICILGIYLIVDDTKYNTNLDLESQNIIGQYDLLYTQVNSNEIYTDFNQTQADNQGVDAFYRSISEAKSTADKFQDSTNSITKFPLALLASIPFIPAQYLNTIIGYFIGLISVLLFVAIFKLWFGGNTNN